MGIIFTVLGWAVAALLAESTVSCALRNASARWGWPLRGEVHPPDYGWLLPGISAGLCLVLLALLGALPSLAAVIGLVILAGVALRPMVFAVARAQRGGRWRKVREVISVLAFLFRTACLFLAEDLRALAGLRRNSAGASPAGPGTAPGSVITRPRRMPSTARVDLAVGPALVPEQVAAQLEAARVAIPSCWAAVAEWEASFDPEDGDDWRRHIAERAAGILTVAEVSGGQAEDLASGVKLDPAVIASETDFADDFADTASAAARSIQVYDSVYASVHEHADSGGTLPENARGWFGADGPEQGGQAA